MNMERGEQVAIAARLHDVDAELGQLVTALDAAAQGRIAARLLVARRQVADALIALLEAGC
jgi:hypothetical protein